MTHKDKAQSFEELMQRYNPFGYKQENGKVCMFANYKDVYLYTMERLYISFPRGYIDMVVFLTDMTGMPEHECKDIIETQFKQFNINDVLQLPDMWSTTSVYMSNVLVRIMQGLHTITETQFSPMYFQQALEEFMHNLVSNNVSGKVPRFK